MALRRGISISGLEFSGGYGGVLDTNYFDSSQNTYTYFGDKGFETARIAFTWERIQPELGGDLDSTYVAILDAEITKAHNAGLQVILDMHNYGRRRIIADGGFTDAFPDYADPLVQGGTPGGGGLQIWSYQRAILGSDNNPVFPATGYHITTEVTLVEDFGGQVYDNGWIEFYRTDDNNKYFFTMNAQAEGQKWELFKVVGGDSTKLDEGAYAFSYGTTYQVDIDVNQDHLGKVSVDINEVQVTQQDMDENLTHGHVSIFSVSVHMILSDFTLDVGGDSSSAIANSGTYVIGTENVSYADFADVWSKIANHYKSDAFFLIYDLMNEPHDMTVPTTSSNYKTTATATLMNQTAINAIREIDTTHFIIAEIDGWAGGQNFATNYGENPDPWLTDSADKLIYSFHYYCDDNHSGVYADGFKESNNTNISTHLTPIMQWAQNQGVTLHCGEYGVPNESDWQVCLTTILTLFDTYDVWSNHWAGGDEYSSTTTIQPTGTYPDFIDRLQMDTIEAFLDQETSTTATSRSSATRSSLSQARSQISQARVSK